MKRRKVLKSLAWTAVTSPLVAAYQRPSLQPEQPKNVEIVSYLSQWHLLPDMIWTGADKWANRLQDWEIHGGRLRCNLVAKDRNVQLLTYQLRLPGNFLQTSIHLRWNPDVQENKGVIGFLWGIQGRFDDYRSACIAGKGVVAGVNEEGYLVLGDLVSYKAIEREKLEEGVDLKLFLNNDDSHVKAELAVWHQGQPIITLQRQDFLTSQLEGNIGLMVDFENEDTDHWSADFAHWELRGDLLNHYPDHTFGPIYFAQYTLSQDILKLTAQLAPLDLLDQKVKLWLRQEDGDWEEKASANVEPEARTVHFRLEDWEGSTAYDYRLTTEIKLNDEEAASFEYTGTIAAEPEGKNKISALVFSCNWDLGFPDNDLHVNVQKHDADMALFLGDQFYEANGGYGIQMSPPEKAALDYLRKWILFGWSHRETFRHIPSVFLPDDHDVYHGNVWGEGGKATDADGASAERQDSGGYKMPADWVNIVQLTQTSHMPDPYDPTPVKQGITVYYTRWKYAGIDFGIIEDRKFKSAPKNILPIDAEVYNGYAQNDSFDLEKFSDYEEAALIGDRQKKFLKEWIEDWSGNTQMKSLLSATSFMTLQTLPKGSKNDQITPKLEIPAPGEYVGGDYYTQDMDSNGWPQVRRNEIVRILRKAYVPHIVGDQHLASVVQYGVDEFGDSNFVFTVPAISNIWPRRWWPPVTDIHQPVLGREKYTGDFYDGFGNKMTVFSVANPVQTKREPALLYDRSTGYGVVHFHKDSRRIRFECWPRFSDPSQGNQGQYDDWPFEISQLDNFGYRSTYQLPRIAVKGMENPVIRVSKKTDDELVSVLRVPNTLLPYAPKVLERGEYRVSVGDPDEDRWRSVEVSTDMADLITIEF